MITRRTASAGLVTSAIVAGAPELALPEGTIRDLPPPRTSGGKLLLDALKLRRSTREYSDRALAPQVLSDLLWSAFGINRPTGDRTAPYWRHIMVIDLYAAMADSQSAMSSCLICRRTFAQKQACKISWRPLRSILSMSPTANACKIFQKTSVGFLPSLTRGSLARTSIYFARRKVLQRSFEVLSITMC